jgi:hypothetical protein
MEGMKLTRLRKIKVRRRKIGIFHFKISDLKGGIVSSSIIIGLQSSVVKPASFAYKNILTQFHISIWKPSPIKYFKNEPRCANIGLAIAKF